MTLTTHQRQNPKMANILHAKGVLHCLDSDCDKVDTFSQTCFSLITFLTPVPFFGLGESDDFSPLFLKPLLPSLSGFPAGGSAESSLYLGSTLLARTKNSSRSSLERDKQSWSVYFLTHRVNRSKAL